MTIRKLLLPTLVAAALATPAAFAQNADAKDQDHSQHQGQSTASRDKAKAGEARSDARKDASQDKVKAKSKKSGRSAGEQPDEPEEEGR